MDLESTEQEMTFDWRKYLDIALRHKWIVIIPALLGFFGAMFFAFSLPKVYESSSLILVENKQLLEPLIQGIAVSTSVQQRLNSLREEILSWPRLMQLIEELGLDKNAKSPQELEMLVLSLKQKIKVGFKKVGDKGSSNIIYISYEDSIPVNAQNVVKTISDILIERNVKAQSMEANDAIRFIEQQLQEYRDKLEFSENELRKFKEAYTYSLPVAARVNQQIVDLEIQLNALLVENTEHHPQVIEIRKKIAQLKGEREKELNKVSATGVNIVSPEFKEISYSVPRQEQELARLQRDTEVNQKLYSELLSRLESARISQKLDNSEEETRFKVIEPPRLPIKPIKPKVERIILFGLALGCGVGCGLAFLLEISNSSFRSVDEAKKQLELPILGTISKIEIDPLYGKVLSSHRAENARRMRKKQELSQGEEARVRETKDTSFKGRIKSLAKALGLY